MKTDGITISPVPMAERKALDFRAGDTVRVHQKIRESDGKFRVQIFEGMVLGRKHGTEAGGTFTVRKVTSGVGVEKIYPLYSPNIEKIEVAKRSKSRRSKLYFIRTKATKEVNKDMSKLRAAREEAPVAAAEVAAPKAEAKAEAPAKE